MNLTDQLDIINPKHVSIIRKGNELIVYIEGEDASMKLSYRLNRDVFDSFRNTHMPATSPHHPLQQTTGKQRRNQLNDVNDLGDISS
jgi:hypothetical protein